MPVIRESFNKADSTTLGPDQPWTEVNDNSEVVGFAWRPVTQGGALLTSARVDTDLASVDHYCEGTVGTLGSTGDTAAIGVCARFSSSADTYYTMMVFKATNLDAGQWQLESVVAGTEVVLATASYTWVAGDVIRVTCIGNVVIGSINGTIVATVTDTAITSGTRVGMTGYRQSAGGDPRAGNLNAGPVTAETIPAVTISSLFSEPSMGAAPNLFDLAPILGPALFPAAAVAAPGFSTLTGAADLTGAGTLSATGTRTVLGAAALTGTGSLSAAGTRVKVGAAALTGTGTLSATGTKTRLGAAALTGTGTLSATGAHTGVGVAHLTGTGSSTVAGVRKTFGATALSGVGSLTAAGTRTAAGAAVLTGTGSLSATGAHTGVGAAALTGTGTLSATPYFAPAPQQGGGGPSGASVGRRGPGGYSTVELVAREEEEILILMG